MQLESHKIDILDTTIHYYTAGSGQPMVFIHGHRSDALRWGEVLAKAAEQYKVYAPDLPGFGKSPRFKKVPHQMKNYAEYLAEWIKKLQLEKVVLIGGSMGGVIALYVYPLVEKQVERLVLFGTPADRRFYKVGLRKKRFAVAVLKSLIRISLLAKITQRLIGSDWFFYRFLKWSFPKEESTDQIVKYEVRLWRVMPIEIWAETLLDLLDLDFASEKIQVKCPTLIIDTKGNQYFDPDENTKMLQKIAPNSKVVMVPVSSHVPKGGFNPELLEALTNRLFGLLDGI